MIEHCEGPPEEPVLLGDYITLYQSHAEPVKGVVTDVAPGTIYDDEFGMPVQIRITATACRRYEHGSVHSHSPVLLQLRRRAR